MKATRRTVVALLFVVFGLGAVRTTARQAQTQTPPPAQAGAAAAPPATTPAPPAPRPEQAAITAAMAMKDLDERLTALRKVQADYPTSPLVATIDGQILTTLANFPDRTSDINEVFDRILARTPATATAEVRLSAVVGPCSQVVTKKVLLDRCEKLITDALNGLDFDKWSQTMVDSAKRLNRPEPKPADLESQFNAAYRGRAYDALGRLYFAKADNPKAEEFLKKAIKASPTNIAVMTALADFYVECGEPTKAEEVWKDALSSGPANATAMLSLAKLEATRGDDKGALEHYLGAAAGSNLKSADDQAMRALYRKVNGSETGLDAALDKIYEEKYPNPAKAEPYKPTAARTDRLVLLEMFTGAGCGPCVSADLGLDAARERYQDGVIALAYHANIPLPDPMVISAGDVRRAYYKDTAVPLLTIDGAAGQLGGGARANAPGTYSGYVTKIDKALEVAPTAALSVKATGSGDMIDVIADVTKLPADLKDLRLHLVIAERELRFTGENGIRFHPMAVRAMAGDKGAGLPISETGTTHWTVSLSSMRDDITKTLAAEMEKRHKTEAPGTTPREYAAEGHAYTDIDTSNLVVVAFLQQGAYSGKPNGGAALPPGTPEPPNTSNVLQATQANVVFAKR